MNFLFSGYNRDEALRICNNANGSFPKPILFNLHYYHKYGKKYFGNRFDFIVDFENALYYFRGFWVDLSKIDGRRSQELIDSEGNIYRTSNFDWPIKIGIKKRYLFRPEVILELNHT